MLALFDRREKVRKGEKGMKSSKRRAIRRKRKDDARKAEEDVRTSSHRGRKSRIGEHLDIQREFARLRRECRTLSNSDGDDEKQQSGKDEEQTDPRDERDRLEFAKGGDGVDGDC